MIKVISIVGLTASGKSAIGIELARMFGGEIISCDSRQIYKGMDESSGKVTKQEREIVPHHLLDIVQPEEIFDVHMFQGMAYDKISEITSRGNIPILVGGTGLYTRAVVNNYKFEYVPKDNRLRRPIQKKLAERVYPELEVLQIALMPPKDWLKQKIEKRTQERLRGGMLDEIRVLLENGVSEEWLLKLGFEYRLGVDYIKGRISWDEYQRWFNIRCMQYVKRQITWFKKEKNTFFLENPDTFLHDCARLVSEFLR